MIAAILARRGERIVPEPLMERIVTRMHSRLDAIASEDDAPRDLLAETRAAIAAESDPQAVA